MLRHPIAALAACAVLLLATSPLRAQAPSSPPASPVVVSTPPAAPADVASIDAIITALYDVISGPAGKARDWNRMRSLFVPGGRLMPTGARSAGAVAMRIMEPNDYIATSGPMLERRGFRERELARRTEQFGNIAHVFSTYDGRFEGDSTGVRGINSIQLLYDGTRWWVVSVYWQAESAAVPLPARYLQSSP